MRVLWFLDSEPPAVRRRLGAGPLNEVGWQGGLAELMSASESVELTIACRAAEPFPPFEEDGIRYFEVGAAHPRSGFERVAERWRTLSRPSVNLARCRALIEETGAQVVHVHGTENPFGLICESSRVPIVISIQGLLTICRIMDRRGFDTHLFRSLSPTLLLRGDGYVFSELQLRQWAARERRIFAGASHFIGRTRFDQDVLHVMNPQARYYHCDEVLRPDFWDASWHPAAAEPGGLFTTTRGYARKGIATLLQALSLLPKPSCQGALGCSPRVHLRVAGDFGTMEGNRAIRRAIRTLGLARTVELLGPLDARHLAGELPRAALFVLPSHIDNSPNSLAEAMLVGTPAIASAVGGVPSLARDGYEALLVQDGDPYALAGAIQRVLDDPPLASRLSQQARLSARRRHDPATIRTTLLDIYGRVAATPAQR